MVLVASTHERIRTKTCWFKVRIMSEWRDMTTCAFLFQQASNFAKFQQKVLVQTSIKHVPSSSTKQCHVLAITQSEKNVHLAFNNNHLLTYLSFLCVNQHNFSLSVHYIKYLRCSNKMIKHLSSKLDSNLVHILCISQVLMVGKKS